MPYLVRDEVTMSTVRNYLAQALEFCWSAHDSGTLNWHEESGYVQWAGWPAGVQIECSSEQFMDRGYSPTQHDRLVSLGFSPPNDEIPHYWQRITGYDDLPKAVLCLVGCLFGVLPPAGKRQNAGRPHRAEPSHP